MQLSSGVISLRLPKIVYRVIYHLKQVRVRTEVAQHFLTSQILYTKADVTVPRHSATNTPHMDTSHMDTPHTGHMPYSTQAILKQVHTRQTSYCSDPILRHFTYLDTKHTKPNSILVLLPYLTVKI